MERKNADELCDLIRNHSAILEGMITPAERRKHTKVELIDGLIKRNELLTDALWILRKKAWSHGPQISSKKHELENNHQRSDPYP